ncbi:MULTISPECIES: hypothetical protein [unclassified Fusibacter]|uniref:hypothetical protein n=1 Tax=unclassified Fusibacter TaxID=2624464 RepID=UPI001011342A|nr:MULTISPECIES: hypothetical protein [unclassified Fusibacter]MCK8061115.1 hypothetical protein [Fusibacter sp. A2]NPE23349.1 hypothetical protein [Fusibacter sp. A1]RXV59392.1 hypothetical protein DWB64_16135 [Fusibacter sp. A1]
MISKKILEAFHLTGEGLALEGGQEQSRLFDKTVLKPVYDESYYNQIAEIFNQLENPAYRISKHLKANNGHYSFMGYGATMYEAGFEVDDRLKEKLLVSNAFHEALKEIATSLLPKTDDPWSRAHRLLWQGERLEATSDMAIFVNHLLNQLPIYDEALQIIHSDLSSNILFHETLAPLIIDFSPAVAPKSFADAVLICDSIAWGSQPLASLELLKSNINFKESVLYAVAFRVATIACFDKYDMNRLQKEWQAYQTIWDYVLE